MTIQEAARRILEEMGKPLSSRDIAKIALERRMVSSTAQDPIQSHAQTIEKNIRDGSYNKPKLVFLNSPQGRLIGLPIWHSNRYSDPNTKIPDLGELKVHVPT
jgi:undecaprenyl pyrophosphate synthase